VLLLWVRRALIPFRRVLRIERAVSSGLCFFLMAALSRLLSTLTQLWNSLRKEKDGTAFCFEVFVTRITVELFFSFDCLFEDHIGNLGYAHRETVIINRTYLSSYLRGPYLRSQQAMGYNKALQDLFGGIC